MYQIIGLLTRQFDLLESQRRQYLVVNTEEDSLKTIDHEQRETKKNTG